MRVAVTGSAGQLGRELCRQLGEAAIRLDRAALDVTSGQRVRQVVADLSPDVLINCAAYTDVDRAEQEPEKCHEINATAVRSLAEACRDQGNLFVQLSTDYVFGGDASRRTPYRETDTPSPLGVYGRTKLAGEQEAAVAGRHLIVRSGGLYGHAPAGRNFVEAIIRRATQKGRVQVVDDQTCGPTNVKHLAEAIRYLVGQSAEGIYHVASGGETTWFDFAAEIFRQAGVEADLQPISAAQYGAAAPRPSYSVLDTAKYHALGGPRMPAWSDALAEYLGER